jgi:DNA-binding response OmpR family regulator
VDDVAVNVAMLEKIVQKEGYDTVGAGSGPEALELVAEDPPDLVLLDVVMPDMDGFEVCEALRSDPATEQIPVIMVTALETDSEDKARGLRSGANDYLTKPVNREELLARIETQLRLRDLEEKRLLFEKLNVTSQMVTTLHHEINNPLTGILGYTQLLLSRLEKGELDSDQVRKAMASIQDASERIRNVMEQLNRITDPDATRTAGGATMLELGEDQNGEGE